MDKKIIVKALSALTFLSIASAVCAADPITVDGGTINFIGQVVNAPCVVSTRTSHQLVDLGQVKASELSTKGAVSGPKNVNIELQDCDPEVATTATFIFTGQEDTDAGDINTLANTFGSSGAATGIGIQMKDTTGTVVPIDGSEATGSLLNLIQGENNANFSAYMIATKDAATAGGVAGVVDFRIKYQ